MKGKVLASWPLVLGALAIGVLIDVLTNGVIKVRFAVIYVPIYVGLASILTGKFYHTRWEPLVWPSALAFLLGAFGGHFAFVGHEHTREYAMTLSGTSPITLKSPDYTQYLVVVGKSVEKALAGKTANDPIPVITAYSADYGCIEKYYVNSVGGVDVRVDKDPSWTWKVDKGVTATPGAPTTEDANLPWCAIHFF